MKSVADKMGIKAGVRAILLQAPDDAVADMQLPELEQGYALRGMFDYIHFFATSQKALVKKLPQLKAHLAEKGMLWVSWPKNRQLGTDLNMKNVIHHGYAHGLVESTCLRVNELWAGIKFTHPKAGKVYNNLYGKLKQ